MAIIVRHAKDKRRYLLLGTGYGAYMSSNASVLGGNVFPNVKQGEIPVAAVCDAQGMISWLSTDELQVEEVDGLPVEAYRAKLGAAASQHAAQQEHPESGIGAGAGNTAEAETGAGAAADMLEECPACGTMVKETQPECPSCGLTLISSIPSD